MANNPARTAAQLERIIGRRAMAKVVRAMPDRIVRIPLVAPSTEQRRRQRIIEALSCGCGEAAHHSYSAVARRFRLSKTAAFRIANRDQ